VSGAGGAHGRVVMRPPEPDRNGVLDTLARVLGERSERCERTATGLFNICYRVTSGGRDYCLRIAPGPDRPVLFYERDMMEVEAELYPLVRERTDVPVPVVVVYERDDAFPGRRFMVTEWLPGRPLSEIAHGLSSSARSALFRALGRAVRQLHGITGERFGYTWANGVMAPAATWPDAFVEMMRLILVDCVRVGGLSEVEARGLLEVTEGHRGELAIDGPARLVHADVWHENILVEGEGELSGLVDMDRAFMGDGEFDFAVLDICGLSDVRFFEGYGAARRCDGGAQVRQALYVIYEYLKYVFTNTARHPDPPRAQAFRGGIERIVERVL